MLDELIAEAAAVLLAYRRLDARMREYEAIADIIDGSGPAKRGDMANRKEAAGAFREAAADERRRLSDWAAHVATLLAAAAEFLPDIDAQTLRQVMGELDHRAKSAMVDDPGV